MGKVHIADITNAWSDTRCGLDKEDHDLEITEDNDKVTCGRCLDSMWGRNRSKD